MADNLEKLLTERRSKTESKGMIIPETDEVETRTKEAIRRLRAGDTRALIKSEYWLSSGLVTGRGADYGFSAWEHDGRKLQIKDSQIRKQGRPGTPYNVKEWEVILKERMLCCKDRHYYVREKF